MCPPKEIPAYHVTVKKGQKKFSHPLKDAHEKRQLELVNEGKLMKGGAEKGHFWVKQPRNTKRERKSGTPLKAGPPHQ